MTVLMTTQKIRIALAGNPNAGKSTVFNALTGAHQHTGNWPGKTVALQTGSLSLNGHHIELIDLPGTYSLSAFSAEEIVTRDFILDECPDVIVAVADASNLERNLYLVLQLLEMGSPVILALNMWDIAESRGITVDQQRLSALLGGVPVIRMIGNRQVGLSDLKRAVEDVLHDGTGAVRSLGLPLDDMLAKEHAALVELVQNEPALYAMFDAPWMAIKLLELDEDILSRVEPYPHITAAVEAACERISQQTGEDPDTLIADRRYQIIGEIAEQVITRGKQDAGTRSDRIDAVLAHPVWGVPIFLLLMWFVFQLTANASAPLVDWIDAVIGGPIVNWTHAAFKALGLEGTWLASAVIDGAIAGVGGVLVFIPVLLSLFMAISILEDSGYMARAAFVMDRFMQKLGLHGKSFLPLLVGFGCTVPAVYATRTLEHEDDRKITAFLTTFMSCGARLPIYVIFGTAFFGSASGTLVFAMYLAGIAVAVLTSLLLTRVVYRNKPVPPFVMELPPYRMPNRHTIAVEMWTQTRDFLRRAATLILVASLVIWLLLALPVRGKGEFANVAPEDSLFGSVSAAMAPVLAPAGFGTWQAAGALITGLSAKEVVISTMSQLYLDTSEDEAATSTSFADDVKGIVSGLGEALVLTGQEFVNIVPRTVNLLPGVNVPELNILGADADEAEEDTSQLNSALRSAFTPLAAVAFNVFVLLYVPCVAAVSAMRHEYGTRWMLTQAAYTLAVAWLVSVLVYQVGRLLGA